MPSPREFRVLREDLRTDERGRLSLGGELKNRHYKMLMNDQGELLLVPMASIPERELWLFRNPNAKAAVERGLDEAREGRFATQAPDLAAALMFAESLPDEVEEKE